MRFFILTIFICILSLPLSAQNEDVKQMHASAKNYMLKGDFDNAVLLLSRALEKEKNNLELYKDLILSYYMKRDYTRAVENVKNVIEREDADETTYQIAGMVYRAIEEAKEFEKVYKKALRKFPKSGPLLSEYGEYLWARKDYSAIKFWEEGIKVDPSYSGNYYNAARYYFFTKDKVWSLLYGEIFVNMETTGERCAAMKEMLYKGYKEKLFSETDLLKSEESNKNPFARRFLEIMNRYSSMVNKGINTDVLIMIRTRFILDWFADKNNVNKFPFRLFDYLKQLISEGMFEAYNRWLFGPAEDLAAYDKWIKSHQQEYNKFIGFQKNRVFRMPAGQYYQKN
ncbi:MAG: hypothetical protein N2747_06380 [Chitinophagaceae bacterium]|nr:hypothetical protein [Chitinophagaceae bacterium]